MSPTDLGQSMASSLTAQLQGPHRSPWADGPGTNSASQLACYIRSCLWEQGWGQSTFTQWHTAQVNLSVNPFISQLRWLWAPPHSPSREEHTHRGDLWELGGLLVGWRQGGEAGRCEGQSRMVLDVISLDFT